MAQAATISIETPSNETASANFAKALSPYDWRRLLRLILTMTFPAFLEQGLLLSVSLSDYLLTGQYFSKEHIAAMCSAGYITWAVQSVFSFVSVGATAMVARYIGAGLPPKASKCANQAFLVGSGIVLLILVAWFAFSDQIIDGLQLQGHAGEYAKEFLWIVLPTTPLIMCTGIGLASLRGAGFMACGFWIMLLVNIVNIAVAWSLVLGLGPLPALGFRGIAIGTASGLSIGGLATFYMLWRGAYGLKIQWILLRPDWSIIKQMLWISIPSGIDMSTIIGCQLWFLGLINTLGVAASAAHGVALRIESLGFAPLVAFQLTAATLTGQFLGAKRPDMAVKAAYLTAAAAAVFITVMCTLFYFGADWLPFMFLKSTEIELAKASAPLIRVIVAGLPMCVLLLVFSGVLRGAGDTRWPLVISLVGFVCVRITGTYFWAFDHFTLAGHVFTGLGLGVIGAWMGMAADMTVRGALVYLRFLWGAWKKIKIE